MRSRAWTIAAGSTPSCSRPRTTRILVNQGNYQGGIEEFEKILSPADEKTPSYLYALGATYGRAGDRQKASRYLQQAREAALAHGQTSLVSSIDRDLRALKAQH